MAGTSPRRVPHLAGGECTHSQEGDDYSDVSAMRWNTNKEYDMK